jgi:hypothetical protein
MIVALAAGKGDLSPRQMKFFGRLKGDRNAYEEIGANDIGDAFSGRVRGFLRCVRRNRARAGAFFR